MTTMELNERRVSLASEILTTNDIRLLSEISEVVDRFKKHFATTAIQDSDNENCTYNTQVLDGIREAIGELKEYKKGKIKLQPFNELIEELKKSSE